MDDRDGLLAALSIIQRTCTGERCANCVLRTKDGDCGIQNDIPANWKIKERTDRWRAFND